MEKIITALAEIVLAAALLALMVLALLLDLSTASAQEHPAPPSKTAQKTSLPKKVETTKQSDHVTINCVWINHRRICSIN